MIKLILGEELAGAGGENVQTHSHQTKEREKETEEKRRNIKKFILKILSECKPINGTLAEDYLINVRGLKNIPGLSLRFHPGVSTRVICGSY